MFIVIFRAKMRQTDPEYTQTAARMRELALTQFGCLEFTAVTEGSEEIALSYWPSEEHIRAWKAHPDMAESEQVFFNVPLLLLEDLVHSRSEPRFHALGQTDASRKLHIAFTLRQSAQLIRVVSARDMHRKERAIYEQAA